MSGFSPITTQLCLFCSLNDLHHIPYQGSQESPAALNGLLSEPQLYTLLT